MFHTTGRRTAIRVISFLLAAVAVMGGFFLSARRQTDHYRQQLALTERHAFAELTTAVSELDTALQKGLYAVTSPMLCTMCSEIYAKAQLAQAALGGLPYADVELAQTAAFLSKTGDYAVHLSADAARGGGLSRDERETLAGLSEAASTLSLALDRLQEDLAAGSTDLESLEDAAQRLSAAEGDGAPSPAGSAFQQVEAEFPEIPTLIYDGPFSQHLAGRVPLALMGQEQVSQQQALQAAADFLAIPADRLTPVSAGEGELPTWSFITADEEGEHYVEVTRQGGRVVELFSSRPLGAEALSYEQAIAAANTFLAAKGFPSMEPSYHIDQGGLLTIHYAYCQDGVICYPDLVKVAVALDTGEVAGFEAAGYYWNHLERNLLPPALSEEEARTGISPLLQVLSVRRAVIPTDGQYEIPCYEFKCEDEAGRHVLVYLNGDTGAEEKILLLLEDETGTLVL